MNIEYRKSDPFYRQAQYRNKGTEDYYIIGTDSPKEVIDNCPWPIYKGNNGDVYLATEDIKNYQDLRSI